MRVDVGGVGIEYEVSGEGRPVEHAEHHVLFDAHARDAGILQRLLGQHREMIVAHLLAGGVITLALQIDTAAFGVALTGEHFD